ncbi:hypothetical protein [Halalkalibacter nanhaiisediminis]|uniref:S-(Hydroxymethyl)glutathione dehydrogenase/alcohol dehydrogenase n=1 Tax=Halalkalibacter nanhaiisediminis TaxID=688079 RepID=A0A562QJF8_9BACI|nr:hypothetical protein [Halalkalibacter nanhaiisediminis]TWI56186.1 S-(hydroxymethyl)glutathione dehydrogenase/alcohol dehydrogenase [Halalkalibacter nanhaiisediminis]
MVLGSGPIGEIRMAQRVIRVIPVDQIAHRLDHTKRTNKVETYNFKGAVP